MDEISGIVLSAFKVIFGSPDVMIPILSFSVFVSLVLIAQVVYEKYYG